MQSRVIKAKKVIRLTNITYYYVNLLNDDESSAQWYKFRKHQEPKPVDECGVFERIDITSALVVDVNNHMNDESPYSANIHVHKNSAGTKCVDKIELYQEMYAVDVEPDEDYSWLSRYTDKYTFYKRINPLGRNWNFAMPIKDKSDEIGFIEIEESNDYAEFDMEIQDDSIVYTHDDVVARLDSLFKQGCYYKIKYVVILSNDHTIKYIA